MERGRERGIDLCERVTHKLKVCLFGSGGVDLATKINPHYLLILQFLHTPKYSLVIFKQLCLPS